MYSAEWNRELMNLSDSIFSLEENIGKYLKIDSRTKLTFKIRHFPI